MITVERLTVGTSPVPLNTPGTNTPSSGGARLTITAVVEGVDIGPSDVAATEGFPLAAGETVTVDIEAHETLWAVRSGANDATVAVLRT